MIIGTVKGQPNTLLYLDDSCNECVQRIVGLHSVHPTKLFVAEPVENGGFKGRDYDVEELSSDSQNLLRMFDAYVEMRCPMCGVLLHREDDMWVCESTYRGDEPCPFRAPLDYFLKEKKGNKDE